MGKSSNIEQVIAKIQQFTAKVEEQQVKQRVEIGGEMESIHAGIISAAIGGDTFSGWPKAPLIGKATPIEGGVSFKPLPISRGPERVAQSGRHAGMTGAMQGPAMPKVLKSGKLSKAKQRHSKWNGSTDGFGTWDATVAEFQTMIPPKATSAFMAAATEVFGG